MKFVWVHGKKLFFTVNNTCVNPCVWKIKYYLIRNALNQLHMNIIDLHDPTRVNKSPDDVNVLFSSGQFIQDEFKISRVELRLYCERTDEKFGVYSLITSFVETNKGSVEMIYDEGFRGEESLSRAVQFLTSNLGISGLILRSVISLRGTK